jgi:hypothetical protein
LEVLVLVPQSLDFRLLTLQVNVIVVLAKVYWRPLSENVWKWLPDRM